MFLLVHGEFFRMIISHYQSISYIYIYIYIYLYVYIFIVIITINIICLEVSFGGCDAYSAWRND